MKKISFLQDVEIVHCIVFKHCILYCVYCGVNLYVSETIACVD